MVSGNGGSGQESDQDSERDSPETGKNELSGDVGIRLADIYAADPPQLDARMIADLIAHVSHELRTPHYTVF